MKKLLFFVTTALMLFACNKEDATPSKEFKLSNDNTTVFHATTESTVRPSTKIYADEDLRVLWNENDCISIFNNTNVNDKYMFDGEDGDNSGGFTFVEEGAEPSFPVDLDHIYAVYPYSASTQASADENQVTVTVDLPAVQLYREHSFGLGANTMIAVSDNNFLGFKNVCGYLKFRFYGDDVTVKSITLEGNNGEKLSGRAYITSSLEDTPTVTMDAAATTSITINCEEPVLLGSSATDFTEFIFVIPPVTFTRGFKIIITDINGQLFERSVTNSFTIVRNKMESMAVKKVVYGYAGDYFTIRCQEAGTLTWSAENVEYSLDLKTWTEWTGSYVYRKDDAIRFRGKNTTYEDKSIGSTGTISVEGNILSLLYGNSFTEKNSLKLSSSPKENIFKGLFKDNDKLISAKNLILLAADTRGCYYEFFKNCSQMTTGPDITVPKPEVNSCRSMFEDCLSLVVAPKLPATNLSSFCYVTMFKNCKSLVEAPELPATTVPQSAYNSMFYDCSALTKAPALPAKNIGTQAYRYMFHYCTSLTEAPALPATTLAYGCYELMFRGTSIYEAPELPATTLAEKCYGSMFSFCPNLKKAPVLPAKVLVKGCYSTMFIGTPINYIKCLAEDVSAEDCTMAWLGHAYGTGPASNGTFVKSSSMNSWPVGDNGIPEGWTVINEDY